MDGIGSEKFGLLIFFVIFILSLGWCIYSCFRCMYCPKAESSKVSKGQKVSKEISTAKKNETEINVLPTLSYSEPVSETASPTPSLYSSWSHLPTSAGRSFQTFQNTSQHIALEEVATSTENYPTPRFQRKPAFVINEPINETTSTLSPQPLLQSTRTRPSSLVLRSPSNSTISSTAPSSESGTSASPADFEHFRTSQRGLDFFPSSIDPFARPINPAFFFPRAAEQKNKFKIGMIKIIIKYLSSKQSLQINFLKGFQIPIHIQYRKYELYVKFNLMISNRRIRCSKPLKFCSNQDGEIVAHFEHECKAKDLSQSSVVITLCKAVQSLDQGMVIGSAFISLQELPLAESENYDSGVLELPLQDSNPNQMIFCGGFLEGSLSLSAVNFFLQLTDVRFCQMDLSKIRIQEEKKENVSIYLKITVYEKGEPVFWRRSSPVTVSTYCNEVTMASQVFLEVSFNKHIGLQLVLSVRLKTGKRGERCVLGNIYFSELWLKEKFPNDEDLSSIVNFQLPLEY